MQQNRPMNTKNPIKVHDEYADTYDASVKEYHSHLHELLFGMCYEFIQPGDSLLDIGIGTGLSSVNFARAGVDVYGMDPSSNMIEQCRKKGFAKELKQHSLTDPVWSKKSIRPAIRGYAALR
jgi:ubiquinone/menaquinone biosynthesis C-methylase UbiE